MHACRSTLEDPTELLGAWDDERPRVDVAPLRVEPCWTAACATCSTELEDLDEGVVLHYDTAQAAIAAAVDGDWLVVDAHLLCPVCVQQYVDDHGTLSLGLSRNPGPGQLALDGSEMPT